MTDEINKKEKKRRKKEKMEKTKKDLENRLVSNHLECNIPIIDKAKKSS